MHKQIDINLPVADLSRSRAFLDGPIRERIAMDPNARPPA